MQILSSIAFFIATIIVARYLGPEHFGDFSAAYSVATIAYIVCLLGADIGLLPSNSACAMYSLYGLCVFHDCVLVTLAVPHDFFLGCALVE